MDHDERRSGVRRRPDNVPPGWPDGVRPPEVPGWQHTAAGWLLDLCPPDYRGYLVLTRQILALAYLAGHHVEANLMATRDARARARAALSDEVAPTVIDELLAALDAEEVRLLAAQRGVRLVTQALRGVHHVPRL